MTLTTLKLCIILIALATLISCEKEILFNEDLHQAKAIIEGEAWNATARASVQISQSTLNPKPLAKNYLQLSLSHTYPNEVDLENLIIHLPFDRKVECYNVRHRTSREYRASAIGVEAYFFMFGSELDGIRESYRPDTARAEVSTICVTKYSSKERVVEGTFDLYLKTEDGFPYYDDANRPRSFAIRNGTFIAHLTE